MSRHADQVRARRAAARLPLEDDPKAIDAEIKRLRRRRRQVRQPTPTIAGAIVGTVLIFAAAAVAIGIIVLSFKFLWWAITA